MATTTVQAGSALHVLGRGDQAGGQDGNLRGELIAIRETSKAALTEMRDTLGQLRNETPMIQPNCAQLAGAAARAARGGDRRSRPGHHQHRRAAAAGHPGREPRGVPDPAGVPTNVLRHAGAQARATVWLSYEPGVLAIRVSDDGDGPPADDGGRPSGHGLTGMAERAAAVGGSFSAAAGPDGGFEVRARSR